MINSPAFQFYPESFLSATAHWSTAEVGCYIRLLSYQWIQGSLPSDPIELSRLAGELVPSRVLDKFSQTKNGLKNDKLEAISQAQITFRMRKRLEKRKNRDGDNLATFGRHAGDQMET